MRLERSGLAGAARVLNHVPNRVEERRLCAQTPIPEPLAEQVVDPPVLLVEPDGVRGVQLAHAGRETALADGDDEVVVVVHQDIREDRPAVLLCDAVDGHAEVPAVALCLEDRALVVPTCDDVVVAGALVAELGRHARDGRCERVTRVCPFHSRPCLFALPGRWQPPDVARFGRS